MLLDDAVHVVVHMGAEHDAVLPFQLALGIVHGLGIEVVVLFLVAYEPSLFLEFAELFGAAGVYALVVFAGAFGEVDFGFDDVVERHFVVAGFGAGFLAVEHVVRTAFYLFNEVFRRTDAAERFYFWHSM